MANKPVYQITAKEQSYWDKDNGVRVVIEPYTSLTPIYGVMIREGKGVTDDPVIALQFFDSNYTVVPDPHVAAQELALETISENVRLGVQEEEELERIKTDFRAWRKKNNVTEPVKD